MAVSVTGAAWTNGMTVNAANVGVSAISTSGTLSCATAPASDLWPSAAATTKLSATENASVTILVESQVFTGTVTAGNHGTQSIWVRAKRTDAGVSLTDGAFGFINTTTLNAKSIGTLLQVKKNTAQPGKAGGLVGYIYNITDNSGRNLTEAGPCVNADGSYVSTGAAGNFPVIAFDQWTEISLYRKAGGAATGFAALVVNGQIVGRTDLYDTGTTAAQQNAFTVVLPALTGVQWEIGAMKTTHTAAASTPALFTDAYRAPSHHTRVRRWPTTFSTLTTATMGDNWLITTADADTKWASRPVSVAKLGGPAKERIIAVANNTGTNTLVATSTREIGTPVYNADGWVWYVWEDIVLANVTNGYIGITAAGSGSLLQVNSETPAQYASIVWDSNNRFYDSMANTNVPLFALTSTGHTQVTIGMGFNSDGRRAYFCIDKTAHPIGTPLTKQKIIHSGPLNSWTPANLGKAKVSFDYMNNVRVEFGGWSEHRYPAIAGCDSFSSNRFSVLNWKYVSWASVSTSVLVGDTLKDSNGAGLAVYATDVTGKWAVGYATETFGAPTTIFRSGSQVGTVTTGVAAAGLTWIGHGAVTGTLVRAETLTAGTSGATMRLCTSGILDGVGYGVPANTLGVYPINANVLLGSEVLTGGTSGATTTGDIPQQGCYRDSITNGTSANVYSFGLDAHSPGFVCPFDPGAASGYWAIDFVGAAGRGGHTMDQAQATSSVANIPSILWYLFAGLTNSLNGATPTEADSKADRYVQAVVSEAVGVASNGGYVIIEEQEFGTTGSYANTYARRTYDRAIPALRRELTSVNYRRRITRVPPTGTYPTSDDGTHYNATGSANKASQAAIYRDSSLGGTSSGRSGR